MSKKQTIARIALVGVILISAIFGGMGNVSANETPNCSNIDALVYGFSLGQINEFCKVENQISNAVQEVREAQGNQTELDIYQAFLNQRAQSQTDRAVVSNYINDSERVAWMKAEIAIANTYQNGSVKQVAKSNARKAINEYYTTRQINYINNWNATILAAKQLKEKAQRESGISGGYVDVTPHIGQDRSGYTDIVFTTNTVTLANQEKHGIMEVGNEKDEWITDNFGNTYAHTDIAWISLDTKRSVDGTNEYSIKESDYPNYVNVKPPNDNYNEVTGIDIEKWRSNYQLIKQKKEKLNNQVGDFVNKTWEAYKQDKINSSDVIGRNTRIFEMGVQGSEQNSSYANMLASYSAMGLETPELNGTGTIRIKYQNDKYVGMLYSSSVPNGKWEVGKTYNPQNISGIQEMVTTSAEKITLKSPFTVKRITNKQGENVSSVETIRYNYQTSNISELRKKMERLSNLAQSIEERQAMIQNSGRTKGGGSGGTLPKWLTETYFNIPVYGYITGGALIAYLLNGLKS